jgi:hypothetical protein
MVAISTDHGVLRSHEKNPIVPGVMYAIPNWYYQHLSIFHASFVAAIESEEFMPHRALSKKSRHAALAALF